MAAEEELLQPILERMRVLATILQEELVAELISQGHKATGDLVNSVEVIVKEESGSAIMDGLFIFYGRNVDQGRRAGGKKVPLDALIEWVKQKNFTQDAKEAKGVAFRIQRKIHEVGISTPSSWAGELTKNWMTNVLSRNEDTIAEEISDGATEAIEIALSNIITSATTLYR